MAFFVWFTLFISNIFLLFILFINNIQSVNNFKKDLSVYIEAIGHQIMGKDDKNAIEEVNHLFKENKKIIKEQELENILNKYGFKTRAQKRVKKLFDTLGVALSYDFMDSYVIDPFWISHGVYKVIDYLQIKKSTFIKYNDLNTVFSDELDIYPPDKNKHILDLIEHHKIGFSNKDGVRGIIVPCAASQFKPKNVDINIIPDNLITYIERDDLQEFPADLFYRFICANDNNIKKEGEKWALWQTGMVLTGEKASALVELKENRRIEITVWGQKKNDYYNQIEILIDSLLKEYQLKTENPYNRNVGGKLVKCVPVVVNVVRDIIKLFNKQ